MANLVVHPSQVIEVIVTPEMLKLAQETSHKGTMNRQSMLEGARNVEGLLGELAVHKYLPMLTHCPGNDYDFTVPLKSGTLTIDVKNKFDVKRFGSKPGLDWDCTIFGYEANKKCNMYLFTSTDEKNTKVWIKGWVLKSNFVTADRFYGAGQERRTTQGSVVYKKDNYVIQVKELKKIEFLKTRLLEITKKETSV